MATINAKEYIVEFLKQSAHGSMQGLARYLVNTFPTITANETLIKAGVTLLSPAISAWLEAKGDVDKGSIPSIIIEIASELPREIKQELDKALAEGPKGATVATTTGFVPPRLWAYMNRANIVYHPACPRQHHIELVTEQKKDKDGEKIGGPRKKEITAPGFHEVDFGTFLLSGARAPETEEEDHRPGCACGPLIARDRALHAAAKAGVKKVEKSGPVREPSYAELAGQMPDEAKKIDALAMGQLATDPVSYRTDIQPWRRKALARSLEECNTKDEVRYLAESTSFEELEFKVLTLREHRIRGVLSQFASMLTGPLAALVAADHQLAEDGAKYEIATKQVLDQRELLRDYATAKGVRLDEVLFAVRAGGVVKHELHELTFAEIDRCATEKQQGEQESKLRAYATARFLTLEAVQEEVGRANGKLPSLDQLTFAHVDWCLANAPHRTILPPKKSRATRLGNWLVNLIIPKRPKANGPRLGGWLRL